MGYFDETKNVEDYIKMAEGYDGRDLIAVLKKHLQPGSTLLELGMGPGTDFALLQEDYLVAGSDNAELFLTRYWQKDPKADLVLLDAVTMEINRKFDGIYSNKVLHHLTKEALKISLQRQADVLHAGGILFHAFWYGEHEEEHHGLRFVYHTKKTLSEAAGDLYEFVTTQRYTEMEADDSIYMILRKR